MSAAREAGLFQESRAVPSFYHVSATDHQPGVILTPGNWGRQSRQFVEGVRGPPNVTTCVILAWEGALEAVRLLIKPDAPSRFNCVFACETEVDARSFRDKYRAGAGIFEIIVSEGVPIHHGDFNTISDTSGAFVDVWSAGSISYWRDPPVGLREVLIGGPVTVVKKV